MEHLMTSEEIAEILHVEPVTIRRLVNKGDLSAYRIGADFRFASSDLDDYLQRQRIAAHAETTTAYGANGPLEQFSNWIRKTLLETLVTPTQIMDRFNRFTKRARTALALAEEEARNLHHNYIGTEHLLLGLTHEGMGVATQVLTNLGVDLQQLRSDIEAIVGHGGNVAPGGESEPVGKAGLTPRAKKVIQLAVDEARRMSHHFLGTEHLLLGLVREGEGIAANVLAKRGIKLDMLRNEVIRVLQEKKGSVTSSTSQPIPEEASKLVAEDQPALVCRFCTAHNPVYFRYCFNCGEQLFDDSNADAEE